MEIKISVGPVKVHTVGDAEEMWQVVYSFPASVNHCT